MIYTEQKINGHFTKHHLGFGAMTLVVHEFNGIDTGGPHDHPHPFLSNVLQGSYLERIYTIHDDGSYSTEDVLRQPGTLHYVPATRIHQIIALPEGQCWTCNIPQHSEREWREWRFDESGIWYRQHDQAEFTRYAPSAPTP